MQKDYEGLKNKDIYTILDGDTEVAEYEEKKYGMPYHTASSLMQICDLFNCSSQSGFSRWVYSDALQKLSQEANGLPTMGYLNSDNDFGVGYTPVRMDEIPDFLDTKWAVV